jgi:antirestriction protein ArdC
MLGEHRDNNPIADCESIVDAMPNRPAFEQSDAAWYRPSTDAVGMPARGLFHSSEEYYSTLFHELTHSTGHPSRIGREGIEKLNTFGSESYSREELIAEMGAAMLCGVTGIAPSTLENSAAYLQSWITRLKSDSKLIVQAASAAQKAADYIRNDAKSAESESQAEDGRLMGLFDNMPERGQSDHAEQAGLAFPASLTDKYRPRTLAEFVGLEKPKKVLTNL